MGSTADDRSVPIEIGRRDDPVVACTLPTDALPERLDEWARLLEHVIAREPLAEETGLRLSLDPATPADELVRLAQAEQGCCSFFSFAITIDGRGTALEVRSPESGAEVVDRLFGAA